MHISFQRKKRQQSQCSAGFTLLEVVVAFAVILAALVGPVALVVRGLFDFSHIENKLVALNLAQEGMEAVRAVRENNILCQATNPGYHWLTDSNGTGKITDSPQPRKIDAIGTDTVTCGPAALSNPKMNISGNCATENLTTDGSGYYTYGAATPTIFARCITVTQALASEDGIPQDHMADIISRVTWQEQGLTRSTELRERLYKWQYPVSN